VNLRIPKRMPLQESPDLRPTPIRATFGPFNGNESPAAIHASATKTKRFQRRSNNRQCASNFSFADGERKTLTRAHGQPPVQGSDAQTRVRGPKRGKRSSAVDRRVKSSRSVTRKRRHPSVCGVRRHKRLSSEQHSSIRQRSVGEEAEAGTDGGKTASGGRPNPNDARCDNAEHGNADRDLCRNATIEKRSPSNGSDWCDLRAIKGQEHRSIAQDKPSIRCAKRTITKVTQQHDEGKTHVVRIRVRLGNSIAIDLKRSPIKLTSPADDARMAELTTRTRSDITSVSLPMRAAPRE
jgi:hypothetical protein